jgi:chromate reductase|nr:NAD(P)H-dependent oxidoreductase [Thermocrispum municipale]
MRSLSQPPPFLAVRTSEPPTIDGGCRWCPRPGAGRLRSPAGQATDTRWRAPGALKNALDWISVPFATNPVSGKPAAVIGASTGMFGAVWAQAETRKVLSTLGACVVDSELPVGHADDVLGADGLRDPDLRERLRRVVSTFVTKIREHTSVCAG